MVGNSEYLDHLKLVKTSVFEMLTHIQIIINSPAKIHEDPMYLSGLTGENLDSKLRIQDQNMAECLQHHLNSGTTIPVADVDLHSMD